MLALVIDAVLAFGANLDWYDESEHPSAGDAYLMAHYLWVAPRENGLSSMVCGLAQSLTQIVIFRFIQGVFSGPLIPLSQSILVDAYAPEERNKALSIWIMGVLGGPALGPIIGGSLAQNFNWRWNFWVASSSRLSCSSTTTTGEWRASWPGSPAFSPSPSLPRC